MEEARQLASDDIWEAENPYLADWLDTWLIATKNRVRVRTYERYEQISRVHLKPALGISGLRICVGPRFRTCMTIRPRPLAPGPSTTSM
jgi:hypothetical protein